MNESLKDSIKEANEISLDSLKDKLDKSKERVEKTKQQSLNANNEYRSTFLENIKSQLSSPTVWSIVTDYKALENRKKIIRTGSFSIVYLLIALATLVLQKQYDSDSLALFAIVVATGMPILQIVLTEVIQSAKPNDTAQLLKVIAEMQLDTKARELNISSRTDNPKMIADWREALQIIQNKDSSSWISEKKIKETEHLSEIQVLEIKKNEATSLYKQALEEHDAIYNIYNKRTIDSGGYQRDSKRNDM